MPLASASPGKCSFTGSHCSLRFNGFSGIHGGARFAQPTLHRKLIGPEYHSPVLDAATIDHFGTLPEPDRVAPLPSFQQGLESRLLKMMISGQRFRDLPILHHEERNTIG